MSQLKLISSEESAEDLCELIKAYHAELLEMRAEMRRGFSVLVAVKGDDTEALHAMVATGPSLVVPNEDEAVPALATCPQCEKVAETVEQVEKRFGYRVMANGSTRVQSWCRCCRSIK